MGVASPKCHDPAQSSQTPSSEAVRKRNVHGTGSSWVDESPAEAPGKDAKGVKDDEIERVISELPSWQEQLSLRGYIVGESRKHSQPLAPFKEGL